MNKSVEETSSLDNQFSFFPCIGVAWLENKSFPIELASVPPAQASSLVTTNKVTVPVAKQEKKPVVKPVQTVFPSKAEPNK